MRLPERELVKAIEHMEEGDWSRAHTDALEFLISVRRFHNAYLRNNELWGFLEQHLGENFEESIERRGSSDWLWTSPEIEQEQNLPSSQSRTLREMMHRTRLLRCSKIPPREGRQAMHVHYMDMDMIKQHHVAFSMMLELPWLAHEELIQLEETFELIELQTPSGNR